jgi:predicted nucleic acid-binding protein
VILVDTSVWIDHLRVGVPALAAALEADQVMTHPFVIGELACGNLRDRKRTLELLRALPAVPAASHDEVMFLVEQRRLMARGLGYIDAHLVAAAALMPPVRLWTHDRRLAATASSLGLA